VGKFEKGFVKIAQLTIDDALILHPANVGDYLFVSQLREPRECCSQQLSIARALYVIGQSVLETDRRFGAGKKRFFIGLNKNESSPVFRVSHNA